MASRSFMEYSPLKPLTIFFDNLHLEKFLQRSKNLNQLSTQVKAETVQALIAIIYIEQGFDAVRRFSENVWGNILNPPEHKTDIVHNPLSKLQDIVQKKLSQDSVPIEYKVINEFKLKDNSWEYEISCIVEGIEYGRGTGD